MKAENKIYNLMEEEMARIINQEMIKYTLADAIKGADVFLGLSVASALSQEM